MAIDQATSGVCRALSEANNGHSGNVEEVIVLPVRKDKASRRYHLKVMKARWPFIRP